MCRQYSFTYTFEEFDKWDNSEMTVYVSYLHIEQTHVDRKVTDFL